MIKLTTDITKANCITHCGKMHADEVFSTAFLELYLKDITVIRAKNVDPEKIDKNVLIYDIGQQEFDHHQNNALKRDNGIPYCSFGLLWRSFGKRYLQNENIDDYEEIFTNFDTDFVEAIDAEDNGLFPKIESKYKVRTLSSVMELFNSSYQSKEDQNEQFLKAVSFAKELIKEELLNLIGKNKAKKQVSKIIKETKGHILELEEYMPYLDPLMELDVEKKIYFVIFPGDRDNYTIKTVPISMEDRSFRITFPKEWGGLDQEKLSKISQVEDAIFCHNKLFIAATTSKKGAYALAEKAIELAQNKE